MKRGKPPKRKTPLKRGNPPKRTALKRKVKRNKPLDEARVVAMQRAEMLCEAKWENCTRYGVHAHHKRRKSQGGADTPDNLLIVCAYCHLMIHTNPQEASERGHLVMGSDA